MTELLNTETEDESFFEEGGFSVGEVNAIRVPWSTWDEWTRARDLFLSDDRENWKSFVSLVEMWSVRTTLPLSVCASLDCTKFSLNKISSFEASLCIIRFVNGLTESVQTGLYAKPLREAARELSLPAYLIDFRHSATHGKLPTTKEVEFAFRLMREWLCDHYWNKQSQQLEDKHEEIVSLLDGYRNAYRAGGKESEKQIRVIIQMFRQGRSPLSIAETLIPALFDDGFLLPRTEKPRVFSSVPSALAAMWVPALEAFSKEWEWFPSAWIMNIVERVVDIAVNDISDSKKPLLDPERYSLQEQYKQSLLSAWFSYGTKLFSDVLVRDSSSLFAVIERTLKACCPPQSMWMENIAWNAIEMAPISIKGDLMKLKAILVCFK